jgi:hypothetical protein
VRGWYLRCLRRWYFGRVVRDLPVWCVLSDAGDAAADSVRAGHLVHRHRSIRSVDLSGLHGRFVLYRRCQYRDLPGWWLLRGSRVLADVLRGRHLVDRHRTGDHLHL